ncbi:hypothetical protein RCL1_004897 [Eukaryota sp. TZLM3-RCL]
MSPRILLIYQSNLIPICLCNVMLSKNLLLLLIFTFIVAGNVVISRSLDVLSVLSESTHISYVASISKSRFLFLIGSQNDHGVSIDGFSILHHVFQSSTRISAVLHRSFCAMRDDRLSIDSAVFSSGSPRFTHITTSLFKSQITCVLIAFEFSSSKLNNQYDQLSLKVFSLLNLQESNTFEFIIENDLMSLCFNEFSLEQDQSIIANITITHNSNQCTTEFPHEVQFNSIVSCSFCISNTGYTNTSSLQIIDKSIELQTNVVRYCSFLKKSVPLFLFVSDYKLVIRDVIQRRSLEIATPLSGVRSVDYISTTDSKSLFMVLICNENGCTIRTLMFEFELGSLVFDLNVVVLSAGQSHSAAVLADGTVKTWGWGSNGRLGHGNTEDQLRPKTVDGITDAVSVSCGNAHTLVLRRNGQVLAFGSNSLGQLGVVSSTSSSTPTLILSDIISLGAGYQHSLALKRDGTVLSWGDDLYKQLGRTTVNDNNRIPFPVDNLIGVSEISVGYDHNLAVLSDHSVVSWGRGSYGRLGNNQISDYSVVQSCGDFATAVKVSAGGGHSLILLQTGELWVTGLNNHYQLGLGDLDDRLTPVLLPDYMFISVAAGAWSNVGILTNGNVVVWGGNEYSQLGDGTTTSGSKPFVLNHLIDVYTFSMGWGHAFVACKDGSVFGWGLNNFGQVGNGTNIDEAFPVRISELE